MSCAARYLAKILLLSVMIVGAVAADDLDTPPATLAKRTAGTDWPEFLGPNRDSRSTETGVLTKWPKNGPRLVWSRKLGTGYAIGSVAYGRLYQYDKVGSKARLDCLNAETGEELWKFEYASSYEDLYGYNDGPRCSPLVDGNRVYLYGVEGMLHCLDATTGKLVWKVDASNEFGVIQNFFGVGSTPLIDGDLLIVMVGGSPADAKLVPPGQLDRVEPNGSAIVAFDKRTGKVRYKTGDDLASYSSLKLAKINGRDWCFAFCRAGLIGFEPQTGKIDFTYPWRAKIMESVNASTPVVVDDQVLISETYGPGSSLLKVAPGKVNVVWADDAKKRAKVMQTHWNTPVYHEGYLYGSSGRHTENAELRCIDWKTGELKWSEPGLTRTSLLYVDGHFVMLGEYGNLYLIKATPEKYSVVAEAKLEIAEQGAGPGLAEPALKYPCWSAPILSHGLLYVRGNDRLVCLELIEPN